jgi:hypothetical protein
MKRPRFLPSLVLFLALLSGCVTTGGITDTGNSYKKPEKYNFRFIGIDTEIDNPENDRRSYYKIFIDKAEEGRTTTGLESQTKSYESSLQPNRHLITVEKWVLDQKSSRYVKLNNIEQPKPNFYYFDLPEERIVTIEMKTLKDGKAAYRLDFDRN